MRLDKDWVVKNWEFLKRQPIIRIKGMDFSRLLTDSEARSDGKFYGDSSFYSQCPACFKGNNFNGAPRLFLHSYISTDMPEEGLRAIYVDSKRYEFNDDGFITGLTSTYKTPIFMFIDSKKPFKDEGELIGITYR